MSTYKFRAECVEDINAFCQQIGERGFEYQMKISFLFSPYLPDHEGEITISQPLTTLQAILEEIPDSHTILETLALKKNYTGKRNYGK